MVLELVIHDGAEIVIKVSRNPYLQDPYRISRFHYKYIVHCITRI